MDLSSQKFQNKDNYRLQGRLRRNGVTIHITLGENIDWFNKGDLEVAVIVESCDVLVRYKISRAMSERTRTRDIVRFTWTGGMGYGRAISDVNCAEDLGCVYSYLSVGWGDD
ncbi:hypothetical protein Tco_1562820 [Tanacetum coccineum]